MKKVSLFLSFLLIFALISCAQELTSTTTDFETSIQETTESSETDLSKNCSYSIEVSINNGTQVIDTDFVMCVAYGNNDQSEFTADGFCFPYQESMIDHKDDMQIINDSNEIDTTYGQGITIYNIEVFDSTGTRIGVWDSLNEHPDLSPGEYIIQLSSRKSESDCTIEGHHYFILKVE